MAATMNFHTTNNSKELLGMQHMLYTNLNDLQKTKSLLGKRSASTAFDTSPKLSPDTKLLIGTAETQAQADFSNVYQAKDLLTQIPQNNSNLPFWICTPEMSEHSQTPSSTFESNSNITTIQSWSQSSHSQNDDSFDGAEHSFSKWDNEYQSMGLSTNDVYTLADNSTSTSSNDHYPPHSKSQTPHIYYTNCTTFDLMPTMETTTHNHHLESHKEQKTLKSSDYPHPKSRSTLQCFEIDTASTWKLFEIDLPDLKCSIPNQLNLLLNDHNSDPRLLKFKIQRQHAAKVAAFKNLTVENFRESQKKKFLAIIGKSFLTSHWYASVPSSEKPRITNILILDLLKPLLEYHMKLKRENLDLKFDMKSIKNAFEIARILRGLNITVTEKGELISNLKDIPKKRDE